MRFHLLFAVAICLLALVARGQQDSVPRRHEVRVGVPATLKIWNRPIVTLRAQIDELEPSTRVENALRRVDSLSNGSLGGEVGVGRSQIGNLSGLPITIDTQVVFTLLAEDVDPDSALTLEQLGAESAERLREALRSRLEQRSFPKLLRAIGLSLMATLGFAAALWLTMRARRSALAHVEHRLVRQDLVMREVNISQYVLALQRGLAKLLTLSAGAAASYLWLTFVLGQFPYTQPWGASLGTWLQLEMRTLGGDALIAVPGLFTVVVVFVLAHLLGRAVNSFFRRVEAGQVLVSWLEPESAKATRRIATVLLWLFALIVAYPYIPGSNSAAFKGVSVFAGLVFTLSSSGMVSQLMSGFVLVYSRALKPGEFVRVGEVEGTVTAVGVLSTKIATQKFEEVTIPNSVLISDRVTNYTRLAREQGALVSTTLTIGYDVAWRQVHTLLTQAAEQTAGLRKDPAPFVLQRALSDFYVEYELRMHIDAPERRVLVLSELHANIQDLFNEHGVQIMSPHFETQPKEPVLVPLERWQGAPTKPSSGAGST